MAEGDDDTNEYYFEQTAVLSAWKTTTTEVDEAQIRVYLASYGDNVYEAVGALAAGLNVKGWHIMRDALYFYRHYKGLGTATVDTDVQEWMAAKEGTADHPVLGCTEAWYDEMDAAYGTTHFNDFKTLTLLYHYNDPTQAQTVQGTLEFIARGASSVPEFMGQLQRIFNGTREETVTWVTALYEQHNPERVAMVEKFVAPGGDFDTIDKQEKLKLSLLRKYEVDKYLGCTTWNTQYLATRPREALIEFITVIETREHKTWGGSLLNLLDSLFCHEKVEPLAAVNHVMEKDPVYKDMWTQHVAAGTQVLFPPWRNADYPLETVSEKGLSTLEVLKKLNIPLPSEIPAGFSAVEAPELPYRKPRDVFAELQYEEVKLAEARRAAADSGSAGGAAAPAAADKPAGRGGGDGGAETITERDLVVPEGQKDGLETRWDTILADIADRVKPLPEPADLEFKVQEGQTMCPEEKEGWLCFKKAPGKQDALVVVDSRHSAEDKPLCKSCSTRILRSQKAIWASVDIHANADESLALPSVKEGDLEILRQTTGLLGKMQWKKQWVRATDTGIHYYASAKEKNAKKADGSRLLTENSQLIEHPSPQAHEELAAAIKKTPGYVYFGFQLAKSPAQFFWMRTTQEKIKQEWCAFFRKALERFGMYDDRRDPNPAKWKARAAGLLQQVDDAKTVAQAVAAEAERARLQKQQVLEMKARAEAEREWAQTEAGSAEVRASSLQDEEMKAEQECAGIRREVESVKADTRVLMEQAERYKQQTAQNISEAERQRELAVQVIKKLEAELEEVQRERDTAQQETMSIYAKWRKTEERAPAASVRRAETRNGLLFAPLKNQGQGSPGYY